MCGLSGVDGSEETRLFGLVVYDTFAMRDRQLWRRILKRRVQFAWATWQRRAGFDRVYGFHALRHTAVTNVYRASRDLFLAQRFARHVSPLTTTVYTHPSYQEMAGRVRGLDC
jgi:site-specific recombinase XerC